MKMTKKQKIALSTGTITALVILGACGDSVTQVTNVGIESVASYKELPECNDRNDGEPYYVKDSSSMYLCTGNSWKKMNGETGATGKEGSSCTVSALENGSGYEVLCGGKKVGTLLNGAKGETGANGTSCSAETTADGIKVYCGGEYIGILTNGPKGSKGDDGKSCSAAAASDGIVVSCGGEYVGTLTNGSNGAPGENCSIEEVSVGAKITCGEKTVTITNGTGSKGDDCMGEALANGNIQITCGTTVIGEIRNGTPGVNGKSAYEIALDYGFVGTEAQWLQSLKGAAGANGTSCTVKANATVDGFDLTCGENTVVIKNGKAGTNCTVQEKAAGSYDLVCGGSTVTIKDGATGAAGTGCTVKESSTAGAYDLKCGENVVTVKDGAAGANGTSCTVQTSTTADGYDLKCGESTVTIKNGVAGTSCTVQKNTTDGGYDLDCGGSTVTIKDGATGAAGTGCTVKESSTAEAYDLQCGDNVVTVKNGATGANGKSAYELAVDNGFNGTLSQWLESLNGTSCTVKAVSDGYDVYCGDEKVGSLTNGGKGDKGDDCDVATGTDGAAYDIVCGGTTKGHLYNGANCTVTSSASGATIQCGTGPAVSVTNGTSCYTSSTSTGYDVYCGSEKVGSLSNGGKGDTGADGKSCDVATGTDGAAYDIVCGGTTKGHLYNGAGCTITPTSSGSHMVKCGDADAVEITNGTNGTNGYNCWIANGATTGTYDVVCGDPQITSTQTRQTLRDGKNGDPGTGCSVSPADDGAFIQCGSSSSVKINNGSSGSRGAPGTSCTVTQEGNGARVKCGENDTGVLIEKGATGAQGDGCTTTDTHDGYIKVTCGTGSNKTETTMFKAACGSDPFDPDSSLCDVRDGKLYKTVYIGETNSKQRWMAKNLNYNTSNSWCGGGVHEGTAEGDCSVYGRLYTQSAALTACPGGWHLPSKAEFETLIRYAGGGTNPTNTAGDSTYPVYVTAGAGVKLKSTSNLWTGSTDAAKGMDEYGFAALPAGYRHYSNSKFYYVGEYAYFWSSTTGGYGAYYMALRYDNAYASLRTNNVGYGFSVRCLKD